LQGIRGTARVQAVCDLAALPGSQAGAGGTLMSQTNSLRNPSIPTTEVSPAAAAPAVHDWERIREALRLRIDAQSFATWFEPSSFSGSHSATLYVRVPNPTYKDWIDANYQGLIHGILAELGLSQHRVEFVPEKEPVSVRLPAQRPAAGQGEQSLGSPLNAKYLFSTFVVGSSNQFAHAAAVQVAANPGRSYNPLFLYGGVGLGKTHLMHAMGHELRRRFPSWRVMYVSSERFTNEMVVSLRDNMMASFHQRFRDVDALLVDDVQFLSGKERTQEEFFHTFNTLYERGVQLAFSSDRPPKELEQIEERLRSRFEMGLSADLQPADLETRQAILMKKAELEQFKLPERVALFIATNVRSNIRELEGCLIRLIAYASLTGETPTEALAKQVLEDLLESSERRISIELIQKTVCDHFGLRMQELKARDHSRRIVFPRQVAMWLARELTKWSLPEIARAFGNKHHTTVLHSINKIARQRLVDKDLNRLLNRLLASLE
jgi:chromosomal replication initiator protein